MVRCLAQGHLDTSLGGAEDRTKGQPALPAEPLVIFFVTAHGVFSFPPISLQPCWRAEIKHILMFVIFSRAAVRKLPFCASLSSFGDRHQTGDLFAVVGLIPSQLDHREGEAAPLLPEEPPSRATPLCC